MTSRLYQEQKPSSAHVPNGSQVLVLLRQAALSQASELARMGRYEDAELALDFNPESATPPVLDLIARIRAQQGRFAEAEKFWSEAVRQDTNNESYRAALQRLGRMNRHLWFGAMSQWFLGIVLIAPLIAVTDFGLHMWWQQQRRLLATEIKASSQPTHAKVISVPEIKFNLHGVTETTEEETSVLRFDQGLFKDSDVLTPQARVVLTAVAEQLHNLSSKPYVCVVGYGDDLPITRTAHFRNKRFLNIARAQVVAHFLAASADIPEQMFTLQGSEESLFPNNSKEDRAKNRSVIIRVAVKQS